MKYVKVLMYNEYSVFEVIEEYEKTIKCKLRNCEDGYMILSKNNVVKQADTIEELCDEFRELLPKYKGNDIIGYEPEKWEYSVRDKKFYNDIGEWCYVEDFIIRGYTVYGAIWTDKGLKYVAKMDNEGKLVLI